MKRAVVGVVAALALASPHVARAQDLTGRPLDPLGRLDQVTRYSVEVILDSARMIGLPTAAIESKALEGITKRQDGRRILQAVRNVFRSLREARVTLGVNCTSDELIAAAGALRVGIGSVELAQLGGCRNDKLLTVPLVVLSDLVTRGVPRDTAAQTILQLWERGAADEDFVGLWRGVERDIVSGTAPGVALMNRAREIPFRGAPPVPPPASTKRPEEAGDPNR